MIISSEEVSSQFYNGHQMNFGKNRLQFDNDSWSYRRYKQFDCYYYRGGYEQSIVVAELAEKLIPELESFFGYGLKKRLIILNYNSLSDFRQSNIGYDSQNSNSNVGGNTKIIKNKLFIYSDGKYNNIKKQVVAGVSEIIIDNLLYGGTYRQKVANSTLINLPEWYLKGLISYLTEEWNLELENRIKDGFESGVYRKINHLTGDDARIAGHSFWYFIGETFGKNLIPNIIYLTRLNKNSDSGFKHVLGNGVKELSILWKEFYKEKFNLSKQSAVNPDKKHLIIKGKKKRTLQHVRISPDGNKIAYVSNHQGRYRIWVYDKKSKKRKLIRKKGHRLQQITDYSYPIIAWHPSGKSISYIEEIGGQTILFTYYFDDKITKKRNISSFEKVLSFCYSPDGFKLAFSAVRENKSDIYIFDNLSGSATNITNDLADDLYPEFIEGSEKIIFSSNRKVDTTKTSKENIGNNYDLFSYKLESESNKLQRVTNTPYENEIKAQGLQKNQYICLTDKNGIFNREIIKYDSTISYVDTTIHYRFFSTNYRITNYNRNIESFYIDKNDKTVNDIIFYKNRYNIYETELNTKKNSFKGKNFVTEFKRKKNAKIISEKRRLERYNIKQQKYKQLIDSLKKNPPKNLLHPDSQLIDIDNYTFEKSKQKSRYYEINPLPDSLIGESKKDTAVFMQTFNYFTNFYTNHITQQVDFGFLNNSYQAYTGGAFYFNPGLNIFTNIGVFDLFENYRLSGGFRLGANLDSYEYLVTVEDIRNQLDKEYVYHRQTFTKYYSDTSGYYGFYGKIYTNELMYILKYPFNQVAAVKGTMSLRYDKGEILSTDFATLDYPTEHQFFGGIKLEYIFDNTLKLGLNSYEGTRFKLFTEFYQEVDQGYTNLFVAGLDFRFYQKIHRSLIFASRFAASSSFGKSKLIYYLGGVDNWYTFGTDEEMFDYSVKINQKENYVYQAVATNMRGFIQNARNGTNFFVMNNEIRFPVVRYFANRPLNSEFWNNLSVVGFADIGSAWSGLTPNSEENAYKTETIENGPITIIIDKNRWPVIFGYGFGLRTKLFGYFLRFDWAWGVDADIILPRTFYFSLNLDF